MIGVGAEASGVILKPFQVPNSQSLISMLMLTAAKGLVVRTSPRAF